MGVYVYLCCRTCKTYVHVGKSGRSNFEGGHLVKKFLDDHTFKIDHDIFTIHDAVGGHQFKNKVLDEAEALYCKVMDWKEIKGD